MKTKPLTKLCQFADGNGHGEILILPDGKILAHNITPVMAEILAELNPADEAMKRRAEQQMTLKNELSS